MSSEATRAGTPTALALAEEAHSLVQKQPRRALAVAEQARRLAALEGDEAAAVAAWHALGWAQCVLGDATTGITSLRAGVRLARRRADAQAEGLLRRLLAVWLAVDGQTRAARREMEAALNQLSGLEHARSQVHRIEVHRASGDPNPELHRRITADAARALRALQREGDVIWQGRLLLNRGLLHSDRGELVLAAADLAAARTAYVTAGAEAAALNASIALAELALLRGDVVGCLRTIEAIEVNDYMHDNLLECRFRALSQARLLAEAKRAGEEYIQLAVRTGRRSDRAAILLELASVALAAGEPATAVVLAKTAARSFAATGRQVSAAIARTAYLRATLTASDVRPGALRRARATASLLHGAGWQLEAQRARVVAARLALALSSPRAARREVALARPLGRRGTIADRLDLAHAQALLRLAEGDRRGAELQLERGLRLLDAYRGSLGGTELRAAATGLGVELADLGVRMALERGEAPRLLDWTERVRGNSLGLPPVQPPRDRELAALQVELRRVGARSRAAEADGHRLRDATRRQAQLESAIRGRLRLLDGHAGSPRAKGLAAQARRQLGPRALVEYVELDGRLTAITMLDGRIAIHSLGEPGVTAELEWLRFSLAGAARASGAEQALGASTAALERMLVAPVLEAVGDAPLVLVPTGALHAVPWAVLPSFRGRPLVVAPSLSIWLRPHATTGRHSVVVAGPRLKHAAAEARVIARLAPATILTGRAAGADATLAALDGARVAHLACHGHFRADSPLFSSLELADGPLNVYDLQTLKQPPEIVVLSACDLALSSLHPGDELLGFAAALLGMGTRTIVASVVPVPDAEARRTMVAFHRHLLAGQEPAEALARAQAKALVPGFVCLGSA